MQHCHSCAYTTVTTELPGYTPGVCVGCSTYVAQQVVAPVTTIGVAPVKPTSTKTYLAVTAAAAPAKKLEVAAGAIGGLVALAAVAL